LLPATRASKNNYLKVIFVKKEKFIIAWLGLHERDEKGCRVLLKWPNKAARMA